MNYYENYYQGRRHVTVEEIAEAVNKRINKTNMKLTKEVAELMYKSEDESVRAFALSNYPELGEKPLPKTWEELVEIKGGYVSTSSEIKTTNRCAIFNENKNVFPTEELAEASLALTQLLQLRDRYNEDWKADWSNTTYKYVIVVYETEIVKDWFDGDQRVMHFKTEELRDLFFENFIDLLEIAKPLL